jgi:hypothetical protein
MKTTYRRGAPGRRRQPRGTLLRSSLRVPTELRAWLREESTRRGCSVSALVAALLESARALIVGGSSLSTCPRTATAAN